MVLVLSPSPSGCDVITRVTIGGLSDVVNRYDAFILDQFGDLEGCFLIFTQGVFTDKLHDFDKIIFHLKDGLDLFFVSHEIWISLGIVFIQSLLVV